MPNEYPPPFDHSDFVDPLVTADALSKKKVLAIRSPFNRNVTNSLGQPVVSLEELKVTSNRTGKSSHMSFKDDPGATVRSDSKEKRFHFAPEVEMLTVKWEVKGAQHVTRVRLEVFKLGVQAALFTKRLTYTAGHFPAKGSTTFDGNLRALPVHGTHYTEAHTHNYVGAEFPFDVLTVEHSPYKLKLTIENPNGALHRYVPSRWVYLDVLMGEFELDWGPYNLLAPSPVLPTNGANPIQRDQQVYDALTDVQDAENLSGALPRPGQRKKVPLQAHTFYQATNELTGNFNWSQFHALWGEGPNVPLILKPAVLRSDGVKLTGAAAVHALGAQKFVWEWIDDAQDLPGALYEIVPSSRTTPANFAAGQADAIAFVHHAMNFDAAATSPQGRNCHVERGGKRGPGAPQVFPAHAGGGALPFVVTNPAAGNWCAVSTLATAGAHAGQTGVIFQPSIQAGDAFKLRVGAVYGGMVDPANGWNAFHTEMDDLPAEIRVDLGTFEVWKRVSHIVLNAMPNGIQGPQLATFKKRLATLFIDVKNAQRSLNAYTQVLAGMYANNVVACPSANQLEAPLREALADANAHVDTTCGVWFKPWAQWKTDFINNTHLGNLNAAATWASVYTNPAVAFWRGDYGLVPFAEPWPANIVNTANALDTDTSITINISGGHLNDPPTVRPPIVAPNAAAVYDLVKDSMLSFFVDARGQFRTGTDQPLAVAVTAPAGDFVNVGHEIERAIADANDDRCKSTYDNALARAWGFRVMDLVVGDLLGAEDGLITIQFDKPSNIGFPPSAKAYFAPASRASIYIFMLKTVEMDGTMCHETGHAMFVNHQFYEQVDNDPGELHDEAASHHCTMSSPAAQRNFCGFCMLRLRSWSIYKLDAARAPEAKNPAPFPPVHDMHVRTLVKNGASNKRP